MTEFLPLIKELIDESGEAFCLLDKSNIILHANPKMCALANYPCTEFLQLSPGQLFVPEINLSEASSEVISTLQQKGGTLPVKVKVKYLEKQGLILLKVQESGEVDYKLKYQKVSKDLEQFAYIISHDLNAPLRAIMNLSEWIEDDLGDTENEELMKFLALLKSRVMRMQGLITGVLEYSRAGRIKDAPEEVDINLLVREIYKSLDKPTFSLVIQDPLPVITTVRKKLYLIFFHLISNAIRHHPNDSGNIEIGYKKLGDGELEFYVKDDGAGISPEHQEKIFLMFQTLEPKDKVDTTGAGLTIVKKIVEDNEGVVRVESDIGQGAKFIFTWK
ncbi:MAG TPA: ATP-binding protein [Cytophagaceae bacterium]